MIGWELINNDALADVFGAASNNLTEIAWLNDPVSASEHRRKLNRDFAAALAAASGQNRAACTGPHTQTETVNLRAAAVVGLVSTLRHRFSSASGRNGQGDGLHSEAQPEKNTVDVGVSQTVIPSVVHNQNSRGCVA